MIKDTSKLLPIWKGKSEEQVLIHILIKHNFEFLVKFYLNNPTSKIPTQMINILKISTFLSFSLKK